MKVLIAADDSNCNVIVQLLQKLVEKAVIDRLPESKEVVVVGDDTRTTTYVEYHDYPASDDGYIREYSSPPTRRMASPNSCASRSLLKAGIRSHTVKVESPQDLRAKVKSMPEILTTQDVVIVGNSWVGAVTLSLVNVNVRDVRHLVYRDARGKWLVDAEGGASIPLGYFDERDALYMNEERDVLFRLLSDLRRVEKELENFGVCLDLKFEGFGGWISHSLEIYFGLKPK